MQENPLSFDQLPNAVTMLTQEVSELKRLLIEQSDQKPTKQPEQPLTVQQAAEFLTLTVPTIYSKVSRGELPYMKRGKRLYFSSTELLQFLKDGRRLTNTEIEEAADDYLQNHKKGL